MGSAKTWDCLILSKRRGPSEHRSTEHSGVTGSQNLLLTRELYLGVSVTLLVDMNVLLAAWTVVSIGDIDFLL